MCECDDWELCEACMEVEADRAEFEASMDGPADVSGTAEDWGLAQIIGRMMRDGK